MDVQECLSQGVGLDELIKTVFDFDNDSYEEFKAQANRWLTVSLGHTTFAEVSEVYRDKLKQGVNEPALYGPLSNMANFILTNAMSSSNTPPERRIKLAFTCDRMLDRREPDFCIVPERVKLSPSAISSHTISSSTAPPVPTADPLIGNQSQAATDNIAIASAAGSSTLEEDTADAPTTGGVTPEAANDDDAEDEDGKWKFVIAPLEVKMFRSYDLRKLSRKCNADQMSGSSKRMKTGHSADVSFSKGASSSISHDEPLMQVDDVFSEQTQSATSLLEGSGKQTKLKGDTDDLVQFASYAINLLSCRGDRLFALIPVVTEQFISVSYYSREGVVESEAVDFLENPVMLAVVLGLFVKFSSDLPRLGFNKKMGYFDPFDPDNTTTLRSNMQFTAITKADGGNYQDNQPDLNQLQLGEHITTQVGAIGRAIDRGTSVYRLANVRFNMNLVAQHSYQVKGCCSEHGIIRDARRVDPVHVPEIFGYAIEGSDQILKTLRKAVAVLIDYDLATMPPFDKDPTSKHRTGIAPFMAYEPLKLDSSTTYQHGLHHDLESCFYCIIWHGVGYKTNRKITKLRTMPYLTSADVLRDWRVGAWKTIAGRKFSFVVEAGSSRSALEQICSAKKAYYDACVRMINEPLHDALYTQSTALVYET